MATGIMIFAILGHHFIEKPCIKGWQYVQGWLSSYGAKQTWYADIWVLNTDSLRQEPLTENEVALEINHLQLQLNDQGKDSRSGTIQNDTVKVYYKDNSLTQMKDTASLDISYYLKGAMIELTNYTRK